LTHRAPVLRSVNERCFAPDQQREPQGEGRADPHLGFDLDDIVDAVTRATRRLPASRPALASVGMRAFPDRGEG
jgi:hypothetical protein